jgi:CO/xanthine dehydrogenase FAD-binding subunit
VGALAARDCEPAGDFHASGEFRKELVAELTRRALRRLRG